MERHLSVFLDSSTSESKEDFSDCEETKENIQQIEFDSEVEVREIQGEFKSKRDFKLQRVFSKLKDNCLKKEKNEIKNIKTFEQYADIWNDFESGERFTLPTIGVGKSDSARRVNCHTVAGLLREGRDKNYKIIDCRYSYEFSGGHIKHAININTVELLKEFFETNENTALIFHCEFSSMRAPFLAGAFRSYDRTKNFYPNLKFPEIYVMEGGYCEFFKAYPKFCIPRRYTKMISRSHKKDLVKEEVSRKKR